MPKNIFIYSMLTFCIFQNAVAKQEANSNGANPATTDSTIDTTKTKNKAYTNSSLTPYSKTDTNASSGNTNHTGISIYDNGTGTNVPRTQQTTGDGSHAISLNNLSSQHHSRVLKYAIECGAHNARIENDTIIYYGEDFDQFKFNRLLAGRTTSTTDDTK